MHLVRLVVFALLYDARQDELDVLQSYKEFKICRERDSLCWILEGFLCPQHN